MSGIRIITEGGAVDVPVEVELEGPDAVNAYVEQQLAIAHITEAAPSVQEIAPPSSPEE